MCLCVNIGGVIIQWSRPVVMGILNITPDSFYENSRTETQDQMVNKMRSMVNDGVDIIDVGAYSTRPGSLNVPEEEEMKRLSSFFEIITGEFDHIVFSVDTFRSNVARFIIEKYRKIIINDVSGGCIDPSLIEVAGEYNVPYVIMHMRGTPQEMMEHAHYKDVCNEVIDELQEQIANAEHKGVHDIIIDPGFGFSKNIDHNFELLSKLDHFKILNKPILAGVSRKSMIFKTLNASPAESLNGTTALHMHALHSGAKILRVHDVKQAREVVDLYKQIDRYSAVKNCEIPNL